jgi:hypothetical protein
MQRMAKRVVAVALMASILGLGLPSAANAAFTPASNSVSQAAASPGGDDVGSLGTLLGDLLGLLGGLLSGVPQPPGS